MECIRGGKNKGYLIVKISDIDVISNILSLVYDKNLFHLYLLEKQLDLFNYSRKNKMKLIASDTYNGSCKNGTIFYNNVYYTFSITDFGYSVKKR